MKDDQSSEPSGFSPAIGRRSVIRLGLAPSLMSMVAVAGERHESAGKLRALVDSLDAARARVFDASEMVAGAVVAGRPYEIIRGLEREFDSAVASRDHLSRSLARAIRSGRPTSSIYAAVLDGRIHISQAIPEEDDPEPEAYLALEMDPANVTYIG
jgi:hypothetical protein